MDAPMLASLPWYDLAELQEANDAFWSIFSRYLRDAGISGSPKSLCRDIHYEDQWDRPNLLFSQACGYDVILAHAGKLQIIGTPTYSALGCKGCRYSSFLLVRDDAPYLSLSDLREARCVINTPTSHSGMNILRCMVAPLHSDGKFFSSVKISGAHELSIAMVLEKEADVTAVDSVTYALLTQNRPYSVRGARLLCKTQLCPAPPFVTGAHTPAAQVRAMRIALEKTMSDSVAAPTLKKLLISGFEVIPLSAYKPIVEMEERALALRYAELSLATT